MVRTLRGMLLVVGLGSAVAISAGSTAVADKPCAIATKGDSPVAKACASGGLVDAKRTMRELVKKGKNAGVKFECDDCHKNDTGYDLTPQARDNFKKLMSAVEGHK
jgi:hypothetical protein